MKKIIVISILILLTFSVSAQKIGIIGGINLTDIKFDNRTVSDAFKSRTGFSAGLTLDFKLIAGLGINSGLMYVQRNVDVESTSGQFIKNSSSSIELPLNLTWGINLLNIVRPYAIAGPYVDYGVSAKSGDRKLDYGTDIDRFNYGVNLGVGVDLFNFLRVQYQYDLGLSSFDTYFEDAVDSEAKNRGHRISLGLLF